MVSPHVGGGAKVALSIHRHLLQTRGDVSQLILPPGKEAERVAQENGYRYLTYDVDRLGGAGRLASVTENLKLLSKTRRYGPGVLHVHAPFAFGACRLFRRFSPLRTVLHIHLDFSKKDLVWPLLKPPSMIVTCAGFMRSTVEQALDENRISGVPIHILRNAVDTQRFQPGNRRDGKQALGLPPEQPLAVIAANLAPHKGQHIALKAIRLLKDSGHNLRLWIVGAERQDASGYLDRLKSMVLELDIADRVEFLGFQRDIDRILKAADFLLLPSTSEGLPLSILEAQASGAIVLAAPTAGIPEIVEDGVTGFLIDAADEAAYARRLALLLQDMQMCRSIAADARQYVEKHHSEVGYTTAMATLYDELLHDKSSGQTRRAVA